MVHLDQIKNGKLVKDVYNWVIISLTGSNYPVNSDNFIFGFKMQNAKDLYF